MMKLAKRIWDMCGTTKGSCRIIYGACIAAYIYTCVLDFVNPTFSAVLLGMIAVMVLVTECDEETHDDEE